MTTARPFLNTPHGAHLAREVPPADDELVRVDPGRRAASTCAGSGSRWPPRASWAHVPLRIRIMGEELAIFRDKRGGIGLLPLHGTHRGTSLDEDNSMAPVHTSFLRAIFERRLPRTGACRSRRGAA